MSDNTRKRVFISPTHSKHIADLQKYQEQIKRVFTELGDIHSCSLQLDTKNNKVGLLLEFVEPEAAELAYTHLHGVDVGFSQLDIAWPGEKRFGSFVSRSKPLVLTEKTNQHPGLPHNADLPADIQMDLLLIDPLVRLGAQRGAIPLPERLQVLGKPSFPSESAGKRNRDSEPEAINERVTSPTSPPSNLPFSLLQQLLDLQAEAAPLTQRLSQLDIADENFDPFVTLPSNQRARLYRTVACFIPKSMSSTRLCLKIIEALGEVGGIRGVECAVVRGGLLRLAIEASEDETAMTWLRPLTKRELRRASPSLAANLVRRPDSAGVYIARDIPTVISDETFASSGGVSQKESPGHLMQLHRVWAPSSFSSSHYLERKQAPIQLPQVGARQKRSLVEYRKEATKALELANKLF